MEICLEGNGGGENEDDQNEPQCGPCRSVTASQGRARKNALARKIFSRLIGFSERAIAGWESGKAITEPGLHRILEMDRFQQRITEVVNADAIPGWLEKPNPAFGDLKPSKSLSAVRSTGCGA